MPCDACERERNRKAPKKAVCGEEYCRAWLSNLTAGKPQQRVEENLSHETQPWKTEWAGRFPSRRSRSTRFEASDASPNAKDAWRTVAKKRTLKKRLT